MMRIALLVAFGFVAANFAYQAITGQNWPVAIERSWFQVWACLMVGVAEGFARRSVGGA